MLKHLIFTRFLLIEGSEQGALRKELIVANSYFGKVLMGDFAGTWSNLLKYCISVKVLLIEG